MLLQFWFYYFKVLIICCCQNQNCFIRKQNVNNLTVKKEISVITTFHSKAFLWQQTHRSSSFRVTQNFCYVSPANFASSNYARSSPASSGIWVLALFSRRTSSASSSPSSWKSRGISSASALPEPRS